MMIDEPVRRRRQRRLSDDERMLWSEVTRSVTPLHPSAPADEPPVAIAAAAESAQPQAQATGALRRAPAPPRPAPASRQQPAPLAPLGRRMRQRIARGSHAIGGRLDLHGLTQREAHDTLLRFLRSAQERGVTLALVITGKGGSAGESERGVLKRQAPHWLRTAGFREMIVGFEAAHTIHGGEGALYVWIRRKRE
jgi:DNA-nicking Smr family endonuclease